VWHDGESRLYWVDIPNGALFRYPADGYTYERVYAGETLGGVTIQSDGSLLLFMEDGAVRRYHDGAVTTLVPAIPRERGGQFNDVIADPSGRVFCGTIPIDDERGRLYRLDTDGSYTSLMADLELPNGLGFAPDLSTLYVTDTEYFSADRPGRIYECAYDRETGDVTDRRTFVETTESDGLPDGLTVDAEGYVWSGHWGAGTVVRYDPAGTVDRRIDVPAGKVGSVAFGGAEYTSLFVTTASRGDSRDETGAGRVYRYRDQGRGTPAFRSTVDVDP
jgi:D-xylonolactonase